MDGSSCRNASRSTVRGVAHDAPQRSDHAFLAPRRLRKVAFRVCGHLFGLQTLESAQFSPLLTLDAAPYGARMIGVFAVGPCLAATAALLEPCLCRALAVPLPCLRHARDGSAMGRAVVARSAMNHCHALGCNNPCPPKWLICRSCWRLVPPDIQAEVSRNATWAPWWRAQARAVASVANLAEPNEARKAAYLARAMTFADTLEARGV